MNDDNIKICDLTVFRGKNIYSHKTVMKMVADIGTYHGTPTKDIYGFHEKLLEAFPGLCKNYCSLGYEGGFLDRLKEGTYLAHVLEHAILEMQSMLGYDVGYGKTRILKEPSLYYLVYQYANEICGLECAKAAVHIFNSFLDGKEVNVGEIFSYLKSVSIEAELGPSTAAIAEEARKRGIPVTRIGCGSLLHLGYGKSSKRIEATLTEDTSCLSADISSNKQLTKEILKEHNIPVPYGKVVYSDVSAIAAANAIRFPVVVKPLDSNQGKGVHVNIHTDSEIKEAFQDASNFSKGVIVENYLQGRDYRLLVVGDRLSAASERFPASVRGDGIHTIRELVEITNLDPDRGENHEKHLTKITLDAASRNLLKKNGLGINAIPGEGEVIRLRENGNLSTGGTAVDCTDLVHPDNAELAVKAARAIGIDIAGVDIVTEDISKSILETGGAVIEVNTAPGIRMHLYPSWGRPRNVAKDIIDLLFPGQNRYHFPIVSVTGTNGKTTTARLISHILSGTGMTVGMTSTSGTFIGGKCICKGDNSGPRSAKALLSNKLIDAAVLETARGGIIREGLAYDLADVGVITNITDDHLGQDGVTTIEDLVFIKSLVAEAVKISGAVVLNAEDTTTAAVLARVKSKVILFHKNPEIIPKYASPDFIHVYARDGAICIQDGEKVMRVVEISDIPITMGGIIECNIENCLAAVAALYAMHVPISAISDGLMTFRMNPGRFNVYTMRDFSVMLDYGHNPAGIRQVVNTCQKLGYRRLIGVIGMPGDRLDNTIQSVGEICASAFDRVYIKEDADLRDRERGKVAGLLRQAMICKGYPEACIQFSENELDGLADAVSSADSGDLIVVFYEKLEPLQDFILKETQKRLQQIV